jgi:hypothetical protein
MEVQPASDQSQAAAICLKDVAVSGFEVVTGSALINL